MVVGRFGKGVRCLTVAFVLMAGATGRAEGWSVQPLALRGPFGHTSIALDSAGYPHVAYPGYTGAGAHLLHASFNGGTWQAPTQALAVGGTRMAIGLQVDSQNRPHIFYCLNPGTIGYMRRDGTDWTNEPLGTGAEGGGSLRLTRAGDPRIAYEVQGNIYYAHRNEGGWHTATIATNAEIAGWGGGLVLNQQDLPRIIYTTGNADQTTRARCAWYDGSVWHDDVILASGEGFQTSWQYEHPVGNNGFPCIAFSDAPEWNELRLKYATFNGTAWTVEYIGGTWTDVGWAQPAVGLGPSDEPYILFNVDDDTELRWARRSGATWLIETIEADAEGRKIKVDGSSHPCVAYRSHAEGAVKYARFDGTQWQKQTVWTSRADVVHFALRGGTHPDICFMHDGSLYYARAKGLWAGAHDAGGGWRYLEWFGWFWTGSTPWISHQQHGWMYPIGESDASMWLYAMDLGWLWTGQGVYPWMYRASEGAWLYYERNSWAPRWFYNMSRNEWVPVF